MLPPPNENQNQGIEKQLENTETFHRFLDHCSLSAGNFHEHFVEKRLQSF